MATFDIFDADGKPCIQFATTQYLKNKLKKLKGKRYRQYLEDLYSLERHLKAGPDSVASAYAGGSLVRQYPKETIAMLKELYPEGRKVVTPAGYKTNANYRTAMETLKDKRVRTKLKK